ncbi:MAG: DUF262 domain-containing protein [Firmicutes bacterium]|nr:DUF262 domain-containing protein [Bacillota bacterium]
MGRKRESKAVKRDVEKLFKENIFNIPNYQRCYSWGTKELNALFNDILGVAQTKEWIFMSTIVALYKGKTKLLNNKYCYEVDLVDGQQRITTMVLLLKSICIIKSEKGIQDSALEDILIKSGVGSNYLVLSQGQQKSSTLFANFIQNGDKGVGNTNSRAEKNLKNAIDKCYSFIKYQDYALDAPSEERSIVEIDLIKETILKKYELIYYELPEEKEVYKAFESLNGRGLPVSALDNFKCRLMGIAFSANDKQTVEQLQNIWAGIYDAIGVERKLDDDILSIAATLYKANDDSKTRFKTTEDAIEYFCSIAMKAKDVNTIPDILKHSETKLDTQGYRCQKISELISDVAEKISEIHRDKRLSAVTDVKQARVLLIAIRLSKYTDEEKKELTEEWEKTTFRLFCLHRKDSRSFVGSYNECAQKIIKGDSIDCIKSDIKKIGREFTIDEGITKVRGSSWYPDYNNDVIFVMRRYDEHLSKIQGVEISEKAWGTVWNDDPSKTIEHIFPQTYPKGENEKQLFKQNWAHGGKQWSQIKLNSFVHNIGNLTILEPGINSKLGQKSFEEKVTMYGNIMRIHPQEKTAFLYKNKYWTEESIKKREQEILDFIKEEWG